MVGSGCHPPEDDSVMFLNSWAIALLVCSLTTILFGAGAVRTGVRVLRYWDAGADSARQIQLENETWLSAVLVEYGLLLQMVSLLLLVLAADSFSQILVGAMCATGAFLANGYGIPALGVKIFGLFFYGFWVVLNRLDMQSEHTPLTRIKFYYLLLLVPYILADTTLLLLYLQGLKPDIITSCCGVVFGGATVDGRNLVGSVPASLVMGFFYGFAAFLFLAGCRFLKQTSGQTFSLGGTVGNLCFAAGWLVFFLFSLFVITAVISSYIYAMPAHRCPFDFLRWEYGGVGYPIYFCLFTATFAGMSAGIITPFANRSGMAELVGRYRRTAIQVALFFLLIFLLIVSWFPTAYLLGGGES